MIVNIIYCNDLYVNKLGVHKDKKGTSDAIQMFAIGGRS